MPGNRVRHPCSRIPTTGKRMPTARRTRIVPGVPEKPGNNSPVIRLPATFPTMFPACRTPTLNPAVARSSWTARWRTENDTPIRRVGTPYRAIGIAMDSTAPKPQSRLSPRGLVVVDREAGSMGRMPTGRGLDSRVALVQAEAGQGGMGAVRTSPVVGPSVRRHRATSECGGAFPPHAARGNAPCMAPSGAAR